MSVTRSTRAIVLNKKDWREDDLLFSLFSEELGKIKVVATGAKKIKSKLVGHLSAPGIVEIHFAQGKSFKKLMHAYLVDPHDWEGEDDFYYLSLIYEIIDKSVGEDEVYERLWSLLVWVLQSVVKSRRPVEKKLFINIFIYRLLEILGYKVKIDKLGFGIKNRPHLIQIFEQLNSSEVSLSEKDIQVLFNFLRRYLIFHLEQPINGFSLIK